MAQGAPRHGLPLPPQLRRPGHEEAKEKAAHPQRKPIGLLAKLIRAVSNEEDFIVDPAPPAVIRCSQACKKTGRNFIGFDIATNTEAPQARQG